MHPRRSPLLVAVVLLAVVLLVACGRSSEERALLGLADDEAERPADGTKVELCDGHTTAEIPAGTEVTREVGQAVSDELMAQWKSRHPEREWEMNPDPPRALVPPADNDDTAAREGTQGHGDTYGNVRRLDLRVWEREVVRFVAEGDRVFHDPDALGSTIAVSCDMCHPNAANTHPETYPKYQVQLGRVALLRDMINWCLEHPARAPPMEADDPRMRAMEAYIYAERRGTELNYGQR